MQIRSITARDKILWNVKCPAVSVFRSPGALALNYKSCEEKKRQSHWKMHALRFTERASCTDFEPPETIFDRAKKKNALWNIIGNHFVNYCGVNITLEFSRYKIIQRPHSEMSSLTWSYLRFIVKRCGFIPGKSRLNPVPSVPKCNQAPAHIIPWGW